MSLFPCTFVYDPKEITVIETRNPSYARGYNQNRTHRQNSIYSMYSPRIILNSVLNKLSIKEEEHEKYCLKWIITMDPGDDSTPSQFRDIFYYISETHNCFKLLR